MTTATLRYSGDGWWPRLRGWGQSLLRLGRRPSRRLRLCESLALGERRFVAVIEFERARFLLGGTASSLVLLARLGEAAEGRANEASRGGSEAGLSGDFEGDGEQVSGAGAKGKNADGH